MEKKPKFIIENGKLIIGKVIYHSELVTDKKQVKGGGMFRYDEENKAFIFSGASFDFGMATFEDIKECVEKGEVWQEKALRRNLTPDHNFAYQDSSGSIQTIKWIVNSGPMTYTVNNQEKKDETTR